MDDSVTRLDKNEDLALNLICFEFQGILGQERIHHNYHFISNVMQCLDVERLE